MSAGDATANEKILCILTHLNSLYVIINFRYYEAPLQKEIERNIFRFELYRMSINYYPEL